MSALMNKIGGAKYVTILLSCLPICVWPSIGRPCGWNSRWDSFWTFAKQLDLSPMCIWERNVSKNTRSLVRGCHTRILALRARTQHSRDVLVMQYSRRLNTGVSLRENEYLLRLAAGEQALRRLRLEIEPVLRRFARRASFEAVY